MTLLAIIQGLTGFFKFFDQVMAFIHLLEKTPVEKHQEIQKQVDAWMEESASGSRPKWE